MKIYLQPQPNGDVINWGKYAGGQGGISVYIGEAARIMRLVLKHSKGEKNGK
jgi:hypothetical protein